MMRLETYQQMMDLLPQLVRNPTLPDPVVSGTRLSLLDRIEAVLAADRMTFADLADCLMQPAFRPGDLVLMVDTIMRWDEDLTDNAHEFLTDLKRRGRQSADDVCLTPRQSSGCRNCTGAH